MNKKQYAAILVSGLIGGLLGGLVSSHLPVCESVLAKETAVRLNEIRTRAVHLVGQDGTIRASFYVDLHDSPQFALYDREGVNRFHVGIAPAGNAEMTFKDHKVRTLIQIDAEYDTGTISVCDSRGGIPSMVPGCTHWNHTPPVEQPLVGGGP
jgi:hypothetical protein